jgi:hypothetical protein
MSRTLASLTDRRLPLVAAPMRVDRPCTDPDAARAQAACLTQ